MSTSSAGNSDFPRGSVVDVHGLVSAAELNGKRGTVTGFDHYKDRHVVLIDGDYKALKGANLKLASPSPPVSETRNTPNSRPNSTTSRPNSTNSIPNQQRQRAQPGNAASSNTASWKDNLYAGAMSAKSMGAEAMRRIRLWLMTEGVRLWTSTPFPKMLLVLLVAGLAIYWVSSDPRYSGGRTVDTYQKKAHQDASYSRGKRVDDYSEPRGRRMDGYRDDGRGMDNYDDDRGDNGYRGDSYGRRGSGRNDYGRNDYGRNDYGRNDYGRNDYGRNYDSYSYGSSNGGSSMMWLMLLGGGFLAYRAGLFEQLRGMNFMQLYFLFNIISSMFGGMRMMGRPGMGMGMGRGYGRRGMFR